MQSASEARVPRSLWGYLDRQVKPAVEELYGYGRESSNVLVLDLEIEFQDPDAANVGRLLDYLDFMFRWAESMAESLGGSEPPANIEPKHRKVYTFEIISTSPGSFLVKLRATAATTLLAVTAFLNTFNAAADAVDHINSWRHSGTEVVSKRDGQVTEHGQLPRASDETARQAWEMCGRPDSFVVVRAHAKAEDGVDWYFSSRFPAQGPNNDDLYLRRINEAIESVVDDDARG